jgi:hypothetical protein
VVDKAACCIFYYQLKNTKTFLEKKITHSSPLVHSKRKATKVVKFYPYIGMEAEWRYHYRAKPTISSS